LDAPGCRPLLSPIRRDDEYTIRLVVSDAHGGAVEDRVTVDVGRVVSNVYGGHVTSSDGTVVMEVPEQAIRSAFRLFAIAPVAVPFRCRGT